MKRLLLSLLLLACLAAPAFAGRIICASTTSAQSSGLFEHILPLFTEKTGIEVHVIAVGTGAALEIGKRGDADVVLVHAKDLELEAVREGHFVNRHDVMYNDFVIVGPRGTKKLFRDAGGTADVLSLISRRGYTFISRGDNSGTHMKELSLWKEANISPRGNEWYLEAGQGMAKTLRVASEKRAYTLTDRGTWLAVMDRETLDLQVVFEGDPPLHNQYGVMVVNPKRHPHVKYREAMAFVEWLVSEEGQRAIGSYRDPGGRQLFVPNAGSRR